MKKILLLGSGELGKEFVIAAMRAGQYVIACDRYDNAPAMQVADEREVFNMLDGDALEAVVKKHQPDIIVPEIEAIRTERLFKFEEQGIQVVPSARAVNYTMNRRAIRDLAAKELGLRTAKYFYAKTFEEFKAAADEIGFPCVVKPCSGGSSVGQKDAVCRVLESLGEVLMHGIAIKPGKPTILARTKDGKPLVGLPGHPAAAYYIARLFVRPLVDRLRGESHPERTVTALLTESVNANHGRAQITACRLEQKDGETFAAPIRSKSGLITQLARADGFFVIPRDCEGLPRGAAVEVIIHH